MAWPFMVPFITHIQIWSVSLTFLVWFNWILSSWRKSGTNHIIHSQSVSHFDVVSNLDSRGHILEPQIPLVTAEKANENWCIRSFRHILRSCVNAFALPIHLYKEADPPGYMATLWLRLSFLIGEGVTSAAPCMDPSRIHKATNASIEGNMRATTEVFSLGSIPTGSSSHTLCLVV